MDKKIIILCSILVIGLFVISGCSESVIKGKKIIEENGGGTSQSDDITYQGVLDMLQDNTFSPDIAVLPSGQDTTCAEICSENSNSYCVYAEGKRNTDPPQITERYPITCQTQVFVSDGYISQEDAIEDFRCMCALPPA